MPCFLIIISLHEKVNGNWYRIDLQVFDDSCHTLDTEVFSKTPQVFDLSNLCVRLKRPDNRRWLDTPLFLDGNFFLHVFDLSFVGF